MPPFEVKESGFGSFDMVVDVYFRNKDEPRMVRYTYDLILPSPEQQAIHAPRHEMLTFQNPPLEFCQKLVLAGATVQSGPDPKQILSSIPPSSGSSSATKRSRKSLEPEPETKETKQTKSGATDEPQRKVKKEDVIDTRTPTAASVKHEKASGVSDSKRKATSGKDPVSALIAEYASEEDSSDSELDFGGSFKLKHKSSLNVKASKRTTSPLKGAANDDVKGKKKEKDEGVVTHMGTNSGSKRRAVNVAKSEKTSEDTEVKVKRDTKQKATTQKEKKNVKSGQTSSQVFKDKKERDDTRNQKQKSEEQATSGHTSEPRKESKRGNLTKQSNETRKQRGKLKSLNNEPNDGHSSESESDKNGGDANKQNGHQAAKLISKQDESSRPPNSELFELHEQLNSLQDKDTLQRMVDLVEPTGQFAVNEKSFDFDLLQLDNSVLHQLQSLAAKQS